MNEWMNVKKKKILKLFEAFSYLLRDVSGRKWNLHLIGQVTIFPCKILQQTRRIRKKFHSKHQISFLACIRRPVFNDLHELVLIFYPKLGMQGA